RVFCESSDIYMKHGTSILISLLTLSFAVIASADAPDAAPTKSFVYKVTPQTPLELIVHYPPGWKETDKRPAIVFFFGGGWTNGSVKAFEDQAKYLAGRGMV